MRKFLLPLLMTVSFTALAHAQDPTEAILSQPSMSSLPAAGSRSMPAADEPQPAPQNPVAVQKVERVPEPVGMPVQEEAVKVEPAVQENAPSPLIQETGQATTVAALKNILATAYTESPTLRAEREVLRQQYEEVAQAESNRRPIVNADGGVSWVYSKSDPDLGGDDDSTPLDGGISARQYLYRGGRTLAEIEQQLRLSDAAIAAYNNVTQNTFLDVVTAAMDIQRDRATIDLTEQNREVLARQLQTVTRSFEVGELTRTDVAQAQARLSGAEADLVAAKAAYSSSVARFRQFAGQDGESLNIDGFEIDMPLPANIGDAEQRAEAEHPAILAARESEKAAAQGIELAKGALRPEVYLAGSYDYDRDPQPLIDDTSVAAVGVRANFPIYDGGATRSVVRQAKYFEFEQQDRTEEAIKAVRRVVSTAWNDYQAARVQIGAREEQVDAAARAREGVYKEREVGERTVLDTLDADAELLDAQVALVRAKRDAVVTGYALAAATGQLTAEKLGLFDSGNEKSHLNKARGDWFGTGVSARD